MASQGQSGPSDDAKDKGTGDETRVRRREKRPEIVRYVPKGRLVPADGSSADSAKPTAPPESVQRKVTQEAPKKNARTSPATDNCRPPKTGSRHSTERQSSVRLAAGDSHRIEVDLGHRRPGSAASLSSHRRRSRTNSIASVTSEASEVNGASRRVNGQPRKNLAGKERRPSRPDDSQPQPCSELFIKSMQFFKISDDEKKQPVSSNVDAPSVSTEKKLPARETPKPPSFSRVMSPKPSQPKVPSLEEPPVTAPEPEAALVSLPEKRNIPSLLETNFEPPRSLEPSTRNQQERNLETRISEEFKPQVASWSDEVEEYEKKYPERLSLEPAVSTRENKLPVRGSKEKGNRLSKGAGKKAKKVKEERYNENKTRKDVVSKRHGGLIHVLSSVVKASGPPEKSTLRPQENRSDENRPATRQLFDPRNPDKPLLVRIPNDRARDFSGDKELIRRVVMIDESRARPPPVASPQQAAVPMHVYPQAACPEDIVNGGFNGQASTRIDPSVVPTLMRCSSQLEALLQSNNLARDWSRISELRTHLFGLYKIVLLGDLKFFEANNMEQILWKTVFYSVIERLRRACDAKVVPEIVAYKYRELLVELINQGKAYFTMLLESLESTYRFNLDDFVDSDDACEGNWARPRPGIVSLALISAQKLCLYMGDLARYKECYCDELPPVPTPDSPALKTARRHYTRALELNPKNGRCYNQMAFVSLYNGRKLDAVYYYCRSLMTVNAFQSAKESLLSIFENTKRKWEEKKKQEAVELGRTRPRNGGSDQRKHWKRSRREVWVHPDTGSSEERREAAEEPEGPLSVPALEKMPRSQEFTTSFLVVHGMLFTKVNFETFEEAAAEMLQLFKACVKLEPFPFTLQRVQQFLVMNMFAVEMNSAKACADGDAHRAVIGEHAIMLLLETISVLLEQACCNMFENLSRKPSGTSKADPASVQVSTLSPSACLKTQDLFTCGVSTVFLPVAKIWCDWLMSHDDVWFPAPPLPLYHVTTKDVWQNWADFLTLLQYYNAPLPNLVDGTESGGAPAGHKAIWLSEDKMLAGFYPMNATHDPVERVYCEFGVPKETAEIAVRMSKIKTCCEFMCGLDPPFIKYSSTSNAFVSVVPVKRLSCNDDSAPSGSPTCFYSSEEEESEREASSASDTTRANPVGTGGMNKQMRTLLKEREERNRDGEKHSSMHAIFKSLKAGESERRSEIRVVPKYLVPDTNCLIEDLDGIKRLVSKISAEGFATTFSIVVPTLVMGELKYISSNKAAQVSEAAFAAFDFLRRSSRGVTFCTSRGSLLKRYSEMDEESEPNLGHRLNDEIILTCCRNLERNNPALNNNQGPLERYVVLLTDDRNLRVRGRSQDDDPVPSISLDEFLQWARIFK